LPQSSTASGCLPKGHRLQSWVVGPEARCMGTRAMCRRHGLQAQGGCAMQGPTVAVRTVGLSDCGVTASQLFGLWGFRIFELSGVRPRMPLFHPKLPASDLQGPQSGAFGSWNSLLSLLASQSLPNPSDWQPGSIGAIRFSRTIGIVDTECHQCGPKVAFLVCFAASGSRNMRCSRKLVAYLGHWGRAVYHGGGQEGCRAWLLMCDRCIAWHLFPGFDLELDLTACSSRVRLLRWHRIYRPLEVLQVVHMPVVVCSRCHAHVAVASKIVRMATTPICKHLEQSAIISPDVLYYLFVDIHRCCKQGCRDAPRLRPVLCCPGRPGLPALPATFPAGLPGKGGETKMGLQFLPADP